MASTLRGVIRGPTTRGSGTAGSTADDPEFDAIMGRIQQERHSDTPGDRSG